MAVLIKGWLHTYKCSALLEDIRGNDENYFTYVKAKAIYMAIKFRLNCQPLYHNETVASVWMAC
jgi:hypothetical protein